MSIPTKSYKVPSKLVFLVYCVDEYSRAVQIPNNEGFNILNQYGVLDYLEECYDPLHTQGRLWLLSEMVEMLTDNGYYPKGTSAFDIIPEYRGMVK